MTRSILAPDYAEIVSQVFNLTCICAETQGPASASVCLLLAMALRGAWETCNNGNGNTPNILKPADSCFRCAVSMWI